MGRDIFDATGQTFLLPHQGPPGLRAQASGIRHQTADLMHHRRLSRSFAPGMTQDPIVNGIDLLEKPVPDPSPLSTSAPRLGLHSPDAQMSSISANNMTHTLVSGYTCPAGAQS